MRLFFILFLLLTFTGPLLILLSGQVKLYGDYRTANRDSAKIAPNPDTTLDAVIQVYFARTFSWRGLFAVHTWLVIKPKKAKQYVVYQVIGWRLYRHLSPLFVTQDIPDRNWFNQKPHIILDIRGEKAENLIPKIAKAAESYPYPNQYRYWPGPNSNTFIAHVGRDIPEMQLTLPSNAIGKDYLSNSPFFAHAVSGTGYQFSFYGLFGITLAWREGIEINLLGLVYGMSPATCTLKLPGFGDITCK